MIETVTYNLGGVFISSKTTVEDLYEMENGIDVYSGRLTKLKNTKIVIMYPSDYGYSVKKKSVFVNINH